MLVKIDDWAWLVGDPKTREIDTTRVFLSRYGRYFRADAKEARDWRERSQQLPSRIPGGEGELFDYLHQFSPEHAALALEALSGGLAPDQIVRGHLARGVDIRFPDAPARSATWPLTDTFHAKLGHLAAIAFEGEIMLHDKAGDLRRLDHAAVVKLADGIGRHLHKLHHTEAVHHAGGKAKWPAPEIVV